MGDGFNNLGWLILLLYVVLGAYYINVTFAFVEIPEFVLGFEKWIAFVAGVFLVWGGINYKKASNRI